MKIAILGTGAVGTKLGKLLESKGHSIFYGSRTPDKHSQSFGTEVQISTYREAVARSELVILAIPWLGETGRNTLDIIEQSGSFDGKIVVDATNPLRSDWSPVNLGAENSAGEEVARALPKARVVKAFNTIFANVMLEDKLTFDGQRATLFYCGDDFEAKEIVGKLGAEIGFDPVDTGSLKNARYLEAMAHLNIQIALTMEAGTDAAFRYMRRRTKAS